MTDSESLNNPQNCWKDFLAGSHLAFSQLFKSHYNALFQYARRQYGREEPAHECVQQLFYQLWVGRKNISEVSHVKAYLFKALRSSIQKEKQYHHRFLHLDAHVQPISFSHEEIIVDDETNEIRKKKIATSLNNLPKRQREVLYLKYYENLSYQQIAEILGMNYQSVVNSVFRAIQRLREEDELKHLVLYSLMLPGLFCLYWSLLIQ
ncbi:RNA polymerase sigma factor (sigma-70 family) [Catalinimonas alkaloidigena]|uniref:RNA polymerase sigma factor n=1 Tax=Catalinimonas alkaloidigena TaxID=1075417 RepID=UPI002406D629|nr:sigma-70 family RNA polymerase sigma factor [Catalinimonas alkaloidigena]MDF9797999.1 RNA polymerase sigma factor (sigma-70 family) [Catalinimonas alkaloidigena]